MAFAEAYEQGLLDRRVELVNSLHCSALSANGVTTVF